MIRQLLGRLFEATFGRPRDVLGRVGAAVMVRANAEQGSRTVQQPAPSPGMTVLVVGPGPGVGLAHAVAAVGLSRRVVGVVPSPLMRQLAACRCAAHVSDAVVEVRDGTASRARAASMPRWTWRSRSTTSCCEIGQPPSPSPGGSSHQGAW